MPRVEHLNCDNCGKKFDGVRALHRDPAISWKLFCDECIKKSAGSDRTRWLAERRKGKSMEARLEWLEEQIYSRFFDHPLFKDLPTGGKKK